MNEVHDLFENGIEHLHDQDQTAGEEQERPPEGAWLKEEQEHDQGSKAGRLGFETSFALPGLVDTSPGAAEPEMKGLIFHA